MPDHRKALPILFLALALLFASCGQAAVDVTAPETTIAPKTTSAPTTAEAPDPADSEPTAALLERHAEAIMREPPAPYGGYDEFSLSKNKTVIAAAVGDLNGDGKPDLAATVEIMPEGDRETYILLAEKDGYKVRHKNTGLVLRADEGGIWGDPFEGIEIKNGMLTIHLYGGSAWRWGHDFHFRYSGGKLMLFKTETQYRFMGRGTETVCDYIHGTCESRISIYSDDPDEKGLLLHRGTFPLVKSTFDAPVIDDATYTEGVPNAPSISANFYEIQSSADLKISAEKALDMVQKAYYDGMEKVRLPWIDESRASYKSRLGYDMPGFYYESENGILYYHDYESGSARHTLFYEPFGEPAAATKGLKIYFIDDATGTIID